jgi:hypothetical protein
MSAKWTFTGLTELFRELRQLPDELAREGGAIVQAAGAGAAGRVRARYPTGPKQKGRRPGGMIREVSTTDTVNRFGARVVVRSWEFYALFFENGTDVRRNRKGANRGAVRARNIFVPEMQRTRDRMYDELAALLARKGLEVSP